VHLLAAREQELRAIAAEVLNKSTLVLYFQKFAIGVWGWDVWNCGLSGGYVSHWYPWISDGHQIHRVHLLVSFLQLKINSPLLIYKALSARGINCRQKFDLRGVLLVSGMLIFYEFVQPMTRWSHWSILFSSFFLIFVLCVNDWSWFVTVKCFADVINSMWKRMNDCVRCWMNGALTQPRFHMRWPLLQFTNIHVANCRVSGFHN